MFILMSHKFAFCHLSLCSMTVIMIKYMIPDNHPSCFYTTTDGRDPAAGEDIDLHYWVIYAQAVEFKPVMFWTVDGEVIQPTNDPPVDGDGQHNYSSSYTYTLPKKSDVQMQCHTTFEVQNTDKDTFVAINNPTYEDIHIVDTINVKGEYQNLCMH